MAPAACRCARTQVIYVRQARAVKIETTLDRKEYRPGKPAKIRFALTDGQRRALPGALSLAAVDEAVFSVLGQRPGMEGAFFTLEQELLKPVYAIYPWSPNMLARRGPEDWPSEKRCSACAAGGSADRNPALLRLLGRDASDNSRLPAALDEQPPGEQTEDASSGTYTLAAASYPAMVREIDANVRRRRQSSRTRGSALPSPAYWLACG